MYRHHHKIELRQNLIIEVERTVAQNVALDSTENVNVGERALQFSNLRALDIESGSIQPVRLHRTAAVIGDANVFEAEFLCRCDHFLE